MKRRNFIKNTLATSAVMTLAVPEIFAEKNKTASTTTSQPFRLNYAPHLGMFKNSAGEDEIDQLKFMAEQGFRAFEDNGMASREVDLQTKMGEAMQKLGIEMGVFVAHKIDWREPNLASGKAEKRAEFLSEIKNSVEVAKRCHAKWMTVVPGHLDLRLPMGYQTANVIESLKQAAAILEPQGLVMVLEPLNFRDHPGLFLTDVPQCYAICKAVNSPACKILYDIYHAQIQIGNLIPNIDLAWDETAYFQIGDNPGRKEPTTGEINYKNIFKHIQKKGFSGVLGMEHGNFFPEKAGEIALINAYREVDNF